MTFEIPPKIALLLGIVGVVVLGVLGYVGFRATDPAARPPIPYKKIDYNAYMQRQQQAEPSVRVRPAQPGG